MEKNRIRPIKTGKSFRMSYSRQEEVLEMPINHNRFNSTRFIIVTNRKMYAADAKKVSICFELPHKSGSLYNILSHMIYNDLNMCKIESRPIPERNWEYHFFVDFEGNLKNDSDIIAWGTTSDGTKYPCFPFCQWHF